MKQVGAMLKDSGKMSHEVNGSSVKSDPGIEMKEEVKEENAAKTGDGKAPTPKPAKMTNGETESQGKSEDVPSSVSQPPPAQESAPVKSENGRPKSRSTPKAAASTAATTTTTTAAPAANTSTAQSAVSSLQSMVSSAAGAPAPGIPSLPHSAITSMDAPFIQQNNVIYVFSTEMANRAADSVMQRVHSTIIGYHSDHPSTKKFLQKHPMRAGMYGRQSSAHMGDMRFSAYPGAMKGSSPGMMSNANMIHQWMQQQPQSNQGMDPQMAMGMMGPRMWPGPGPGPSMQRDMWMGPDIDGGMGPMGLMGPQINLSQNKVPDEGLTPEQLQRRTEQLGTLRKIQDMLLPELRDNMDGTCGPAGPGMPGGAAMMDGMGGGMYPHGMMPGQPGPMDMQMMQQQGMMGSPQGMMSPHQQQQMMMHQQGMGPQFSPHSQGPNNAQREWLKLQEEFYSQKRRRMMGQGGMDPNAPGQAPPPSYYSSIAHKRQVGMSPTPNMNGPPMMGGPGPSQGPDQDPMGMMPGMQGPMMPGMDPHYGMGMPPHGPGGYDPVMMANMGGGGGRFPGMPTQGGMPPQMKNSAMSVHRAANPEAFQPDMMACPPATGANAASMGSRPPPSYAQAQKRKRDDMEEIFKTLQPAPSPTQINYLNQFEGQELTITKQLNTAYRDPGMGGDSQQQNHFPTQGQVNSPMHGGPGSNKGPLSNSSQTSSAGALGSPNPVPGPSPMSGATMRLSHYDPPPSNSSISSAPTTPTARPTMTNITSTNLANLVKGCDEFNSELEKNALQGGPFRSIQVQGQMSNSGGGGGNGGGPAANSNNGNGNNPSTSQSGPQPAMGGTLTSSANSDTVLNVNNTFMTTKFSIGQVNIQSVEGQNGPGGSNYTANMQVQQMNADSGHPGMAPGGMPGPGGMPPHVGAMPGNPGAMPPSSGMGAPHMGGMMPQASMSQTQVMMGHSSMAKSPSYPGGPLHHPTSMPSQPHPGQHPRPHGHPGAHPRHPSPHPSQQHPAGGMGGPTVPSSMMGPGGHMSSPTYPTSSVGNANVQIQAKAPNTIQYLPANPPATQASMMGPSAGKPPNLDFMQRLCMDGKVPSSTLQYFPSNTSPVSATPQSMRQPGTSEAFSQQQMAAMHQSMMMRSDMGPGDYCAMGMPPGSMPPGSMPPGSMAPGGMPPGSMPPASMAGMDPSNSMCPMSMPCSMGGGGSMPPDHMMAMSSMRQMQMPSQSMGPMQAPMMNPGPMSPIGAGGMGGGPQGNPGFMNGQAMMMQSQHMAMGGPGPSPTGMGPMMGPGAPPGVMSRQSAATMRMSSPPAMGSQPGPGAAMCGPMQYQQFQQQLYSQPNPRSRQMSPGMAASMMGSPGQPYMGMMPNMPGPT